MSDARGTAYWERLSALLGLYGEALTLVRSGESRTMQGVCAPMDNATAGTFFDANESVGLLRPALSLYVAGSSDPPTLNDVFFRHDRLFTVRKTHLYHVADVVVLCLVLAD